MRNKKTDALDNNGTTAKLAKSIPFFCCWHVYVIEPFPATPLTANPTCAIFFSPLATMRNSPFSQTQQQHHLPCRVCYSAINQPTKPRERRATQNDVAFSHCLTTTTRNQEK
jgi:hypothetical protein